MRLSRGLRLGRGAAAGGRRGGAASGACRAPRGRRHGIWMGKLWKTMENYGKLWKTMENYGKLWKIIKTWDFDGILMDTIQCDTNGI